MRFCLLPLLFACACEAMILDSSRRITWNPGVTDTNGETFVQTGVFRPSVTLTNIVNVKTYGAVGDGITDDTGAIFNAMTNYNCVIYFPSGTYKLTAGLGAITGYPWYYYSQILRGDGPGKTILAFYASANGSLVSMGTGGVGVGQLMYLSQDALSGSTNLHTTSWNAFFNSAPITTVSMSNTYQSWIQTNEAGYMVNTVSQSSPIASIDSVNKVLTLSRPLYTTYLSNFTTIGPWLNPRPPVGIEHLTIQNVAAGNVHNIYFQNVANSWLNDVESVNAYGWHIKLVQCYAVTIYGCYIHGYYPSGGTGGGNSDYGAGLFGGSTDCLIINNIFDHCRHAMILEYGGQGNVFAYNYSINAINENHETTDYLMGDTITHGGNPAFNLWEGNVTGTIKFDNVLGTSDYNTVFRCFVTRRSIPTVYVACFGADIQRNNWNANLIGDVFGVPPGASTDPLYRFGAASPYVPDAGSAGTTTNSLATDLEATNVFLTSYIHGVVDLNNGNAVTWASTNSDHALPPSLWLTAKPSFFGGLTWPPFGPDQYGTYTNHIPAEMRYNNLPMPPTQARVHP